MRPEADYHVAVVGAGPAGCAAARVLAEQGLRVVLLEKRVLPRYKTCGGGLVGRACQLLPAGALSAVEERFGWVQLGLAGRDLCFRVQRAEPIICTVMRADLDHHLCFAARDAGVEVMEQSLVSTLTSARDYVEVGTTTGELRVQFVIAADGAQSAVARLAGWRPLPRLAPALESEVIVDAGTVRDLREMARFDFDVVRGGYGWVFPKRDHLSVGVFSREGAGATLREGLTRYASLLGIPERTLAEKHGWVIPVAPRGEPLARGRVFLVGDAAGLVDPVTAEGISNALLSGEWAARAIGEARLEPAKAVSNYLDTLRRKMLPELRAGRILAHLLYSHRRFRNWVFRRNGQALAEFMAEVMAGRRSYRGALGSLSAILKAVR